MTSPSQSESPILAKPASINDTAGAFADIAQLTRELQRLNSHRFIQIHNSTKRLVWFQFLRGLAFGLGSVMGASLLVSVLVLVLSQVEFVPILGEFATQIIDQIQLED